MQYHRHVSAGQPDDGPEPSQVTECHGAQVDMETGVVPGNVIQRLYQGGISLFVNVAAQSQARRITHHRCSQRPVALPYP
jgi:hypothetical protein